MNFKKICRACLTTDDDLVNILLTATSEMYTYCTSINITEDDILPKSLCHFCFEVLNKFYLFKQKCVQSGETLKQYLKCKEDIKSPLVPNDDDGIIKVEYDYVSKHLETSNDFETFQEIDETHNGDSEIQPGEYAPAHHQEERFTNKIKLKRKNKHKSSSGRNVKGFQLKKKRNLAEERKNVVLDYHCLQCGKKFAYPERLEAHQLTHEGVSSKIICNICNKTFKQWDGLRRHQEFVHMTAGKSLECPTCGKLYKTSMTLRNHQKIHEQRKDYVCHICGGSYRSAGGLQNHVETHQENREKSYECKICNKKFVSNNYLTSHMFRHKGRRFVCQVCSFSFFTKADLTRHMLTHDGIKPYVCDICSKSYSTKSFLVEHGRTHSGERPFSCDYCAMNFISKRRLIDHRRTHTGEKPHKCSECNQAFIQRGSLTRHLKVHEKRRCVVHTEAAAPAAPGPGCPGEDRYSLATLCVTQQTATAKLR